MCADLLSFGVVPGTLRISEASLRGLERAWLAEGLGVLGMRLGLGGQGPILSGLIWAEKTFWSRTLIVQDPERVGDLPKITQPDSPGASSRPL